MATVTGTVISVGLGVTYPKQGGGTYPAWVLSYMTPDNQKREIAKHMNSLQWGAGPAIKKTLEELKSGDTFTVVQEKKGQYLEIVNLVKGEAGVELAQNTDSASVAGRSNGTTYKARENTYETPEERKVKQRLIVRQAALNQALTYLSIVGDKKLTEDKVTGIAEILEGWVYRGIE